MNSLRQGVCGEHAGELLLVPPDPEHHPGHRDQRLSAVADDNLPGHRLVCGLHLLHQGHRDHREGGRSRLTLVVLVGFVMIYKQGYSIIG